MPTAETLASVKAIQMFEGLSEGELSALADIAVSRPQPAGRELYQAGEEAHGFYAVVSGRVKVYRTSPAGKEHILHTFGAGETVAEAAVLQGRTFPASAQVLEDAELLYFPRERFRALLRREPDIALNLLALLAQRLRGFVNKIEALSLRDAPARLAMHLLLLRSMQGGDELRLDLPKGQLAFLLGTIPETLSRVFKQLSQEGLIEVRGSKVLLLDPEGLEELAEGRAG